MIFLGGSVNCRGVLADFLIIVDSPVFNSVLCTLLVTTLLLDRSVLAKDVITSDTVLSMATDTADVNRSSRAMSNLVYLFYFWGSRVDWKSD